MIDIDATAEHIEKTLTPLMCDCGARAEWHAWSHDDVPPHEYLGHFCSVCAIMVPGILEPVEGIQ